MNSMPDQPLLIVVSGAPGSGKTTLAKALAEHMRLLHIPRDELFWSMDYTARNRIDRAKTGIPTYFSMLSQLLEAKASIITDGTLYKGISEPDYNKLFAGKCRLVNVHCRAQNEHQRFYDRELNRNREKPNWKPSWLDEFIPHLEKIYSDTKDPLELGGELIEVDTNNGYNPTIIQIATQIGDYNNTPRERGPYGTK